MIHIIISHKNCYDGLAAAWCAWLEFGDRATYHYCNYHDSIPDIPDWSQVWFVDFFQAEWVQLLFDKGCSVRVLDHHESAMIEALQWVSQRIQGLDWDEPCWTIHYEVKPKVNLLHFDWRKLAGVPSEKVETWVSNRGLRFFEYLEERFSLTFNTQKSGAILAWEAFQKEAPIPDLIRYVDDRDRWVWLLPFSEEISEALGHLIRQEFRPRRKQQQLYEHALALWESSEPDEQLAFIGFQHDDPTALLPHNLLMTCEAWLEEHADPQKEAIAEFEYLSQLAADPNYRTQMAALGKPLVEPRQAAVRERCKEAAWGNVLGYAVPVVQAEKHHSWVGHELCKAFPEAPFSVTWRTDGDSVIKVDLRSEKGSIRVNRIAQQLGGGGHPTAAGFTLRRMRTLKEGDRFRLIEHFDPLYLGPPEGFSWEIYTVMDGNTIQGENQLDDVFEEIDEFLAPIWTIKLKD